MPDEQYVAEKQAIHDAIMAFYHEGHVMSDPELFKQILHPEWRFFTLDQQEQLRIADRHEYTSQYESREADPTLEWETEILSIDVTGSFAAVKLRLECRLAACIDYFNMMKLDGRWWIVHKISHGELKQVDR